MSRALHTLKQLRPIMKFIGEWNRFGGVTRLENNTLNPYADIGANLTDGMFQGIYNGSQKHPSDLDFVLERSWATGLEKIIITVGTISDTKDALEIAQKDGKTTSEREIQCK